MAKPFTNVHLHIFNSACAPDRFFMVMPVGIVRKNAKWIKNALGSKVGTILINFFFSLSSIRDRSKVARYLSFIKVGSKAAQMDIFKQALEVGRPYDANIRLIGLTMNMDYMDSEPSNHKNFATQLEEVKDIKRYYPHNFFPFLGIDPRHLSGKQLLDWAKRELESGFQRDEKIYPYFSGLKIYPAQGFFPFHPGLYELYQYAEEYGIPVMTHCTRGGSQYIGAHIESLIPKAPRMIMPEQPSSYCIQAKADIEKRIEDYYTKGWVKNSPKGENDEACDLFSHPQNYIPILEEFPKLKICLAHLGGSYEFYDKEELMAMGKRKYREIIKVREIDQVKWFDVIQEMMVKYHCLYTDVSYSLSDFDKSDFLQRLDRFINTPDTQAPPKNLGERVLFGTDFFMTEQEKKEADLYGLMARNPALSNWVDPFCRDNVAEFLKNVR